MFYIEHNDYIPPEPIHPGSILNDQMELLELTFDDLASKTGIAKSVLLKIINEELDITPEIAQKLEKIFGITTDLWIDLQNKYYRDMQIIKRLSSNF
jgi:HTH-type transcriptional regulator/antitoxin HigA